jgi:predicted anti-sigma-YlaC factor YlaD
MTMHVLDLLPLWVEEDLPRETAAAVEVHLVECPACREAADRLRQSQTWLREALASPFVAVDQDRLRQAVMDRIRTEPLGAPTRRFAPALLAAAAVLMVVVLTWNRPQGKANPLSAVGSAPMTETASPAHPLPPRLELAKASHPQAQAHSRPRPDSTALPQGEPTRIEFQTADPTIRIIWLAQATPLPNANPPLEEKL